MATEVLASHQPLALAADAHCAVVDEDLVFLDIRSGRYSCLPGAAADLRPIAPRAFQVASAELAEELVRAGLLVRDAPAPPRSEVPLPPATASAVRWRYPAPSVADVPEAVGAMIDLARAYRGKPFKDILAAVGAPTAAGACNPEILEAVDRFHRWIPFAPVSGKCLLRSFMLRRLLERQGFAPAWVFGVATWPFLAHCWLQAGEVVLDDTAERVAKYTPILVV